MVKFSPEERVSAIAPECAPGVSPAPFTVTMTAALWNGPRLPLGDTVSQGLPVTVVAVAVYVIVWLLRLVKLMLWDEVVVPWFQANTSPLGLTRVVPLRVPLTCRMFGKGTVSEKFWPGTLMLKVMSMLKLKLPEVVGVPLKTPLGVSDMPGGSVEPDVTANVNVMETPVSISRNCAKYWFRAVP